MGFTYVVLCGIIISTMMSTAAAQKGNYMMEAGQVFNTIFHKYNKVVPPKDTVQPLYLNVTLRLAHVAELNYQNQYMEATVDLDVGWQDSRLAWLSKAVKEIIVPNDEIWHPDISIDNTISEPQAVIDNKFVIDSQGLIYWHRRLHVKTLCTTTSKNEGECPIVIGSNLLDSDVINFNENFSQCLFPDVTSSHALDVVFLNRTLTTEERRNRYSAQFPKLICSFHATLTPQESKRQEEHTNTDAQVQSQSASHLLNALLISAGFILSIITKHYIT